MLIGTRATLVLALGLCSLGCKETVAGQYLDTEGIALLAEVTAESEDASKITVDFVVGGDESNTYVDLVDDEVSATGDGEAKILAAKSKGQYKTSFKSGASGALFKVELDRSDADKKDAKASKGTLPDSFEVTVSPTGDVSRGDDLTVHWDPSGDSDEVRVDVDGDCLFFTFEDGLDDDGEFVIPAGDLVFGGDATDDKEGTCEAKVTVTKTNHGTTDPIFDSESYFRLHQVRSATFNSVAAQ